MTQFGDVSVEQAQQEHVAQRLAKASPTVAVMWDEHLDTFDRTSGTIFLGEVGDWYTESVVARAANGTERDRVADVLAEALRGAGDFMRTIIVTGFIEALPGPEHPSRSVVETLPVDLRQALYDMEQALAEGH